MELAPTLCEEIAASTGLDSGEVKTPLWGFREEQGEAFVAVGTLVVHTSSMQTYSLLWEELRETNLASSPRPPVVPLPNFTILLGSFACFTSLGSY